MANQFELDVTRIRTDARKKMDDGAVTSTYGADKDRIIEILNQVVATEVVCWQRYSQHAIIASGVDRAQAAEEFTKHAVEEMQPGLRAAERISQLGGDPDFNPTLAERSHTDYGQTADTDLEKMLGENVVAERIVISTYQEIIRWIADSDPTTRRLMESILAEEEEHADDLTDLLGQ